MTTLQEKLSGTGESTNWPPLDAPRQPADEEYRNTRKLTLQELFTVYSSMAEGHKFAPPRDKANFLSPEPQTPLHVEVLARQEQQRQSADALASKLAGLALRGRPEADPGAGLPQKAPRGGSLGSQGPQGEPQVLPGPPGIGLQPQQHPQFLEPSQIQWYYLDPQGTQQGPFDGLTMQQWYTQKYLAPDLRIRRDGQTEYKPLGDFVSFIGEYQFPFSVPLLPIQRRPAAGPRFGVSLGARASSTSSLGAQNTPRSRPGTPLSGSAGFSAFGGNPGWAVGTSGSFLGSGLQGSLGGSLALGGGLYGQPAYLPGGLQEGLHDGLFAGQEGESVERAIVRAEQAAGNEKEEKKEKTRDVKSVNVQDKEGENDETNVKNVKNVKNEKIEKNVKSEINERNEKNVNSEVKKEAKNEKNGKNEKNEKIVKNEKNEKIVKNEKNEINSAIKPEIKEKPQKPTNIHKQHVSHVVKTTESEKHIDRTSKTVIAPWAKVTQKKVSPAFDLEQIQKEEKEKSKREAEHRRVLEQAERKVRESSNGDDEDDSFDAAGSVSLPATATWGNDTGAGSLDQQPADIASWAEIEREEMAKVEREKKALSEVKKMQPVKFTPADLSSGGSWTVVTSRKQKSGAKNSANEVVSRSGVHSYAKKSTSTLSPDVLRSVSAGKPGVGATGASAAWTTVSRQSRAGSRAGSTGAPRVGSIPGARSATRPTPQGPPGGTASEYSQARQFLAWCRAKFAGLYSTVNKEDVLSIMLQLPAGSESTEIIADTIYSNSSTMDGRRFASEFNARRSKVEALFNKQGYDFDWQQLLKSSGSSNAGDGWDAAFTKVTRRRRH